MNKDNSSNNELPEDLNEIELEDVLNNNLIEVYLTDCVENAFIENKNQLEYKAYLIGYSFSIGKKIDCDRLTGEYNVKLLGENRMHPTLEIDLCDYISENKNEKLADFFDRTVSIIFNQIKDEINKKELSTIIRNVEYSKTRFRLGFREGMKDHSNNVFKTFPQDI